jgi:hypothetical protein
VKPDANTEAELKAQLKVALQNQKAALKRFGELMRDLKSGLPHSNGSKRILRASREVTAAHESLLAVLLKMNKGPQAADRKNKRP